MKILHSRSKQLEADGSAKEPTPAQLEYGELGLNYSADDPALFIKNENNEIIRIAPGGGVIIPPITFDVAITGDNKVGDTLTAAVSNLDGGTAPEIKTYVWKSGGIVDNTAVTSTRENLSSDVGKVITCDITCAEPDGSNPVIKTATYSQTIELGGAIDTPTVLTPPDGAGLSNTPFYPRTSNVVSSVTDTSGYAVNTLGNTIGDQVLLTDDPTKKYVHMRGGGYPPHWSPDGYNWTEAGSYTGAYDSSPYFIASSGPVLVSTSSGVNVSRNYGSTWSKTFTDNSQGVGYGNNTFLVFGWVGSNDTTVRVWRSDANASSFSPLGNINVPDVGSSKYTKFVLHVSGDIWLYGLWYMSQSTGSGKMSVFRTTDNGDNWVDISLNYNQFFTIGKGPNNELLISYSDAPNRYAYSTDLGQTFEDIDTGIPSSQIPKGITYLPDSNKWMIYAETQNWMSKTSDPRDGFILIGGYEMSGQCRWGDWLGDKAFIVSSSSSQTQTSDDGIKWNALYSDVELTDLNVYDDNGNVTGFVFDDVFPAGTGVQGGDLSIRGDIISRDGNTLTLKNGRAPSSQFPSGLPLISQTEFTPFGPNADTLEFTSTTPAGTDINTYGNATWQVDTDPNFGSAMTATKALVDGSNQSLLPGERGAITLANSTTYYTRVKYDSTDPAIESAYSDVNEFKTASPPDGWFAVPAPEANQWRSIAYGNNKFVSVSRDGTNQVMYSTDGISWTAVPAAENNLWASVAYGNNKFVAVSNDGTNQVMYSTDGISWTATSAPEDNNWYGVTYGDNKFVAVAQSATQESVMYSTDGITWTAVSAVSGGSWNSVTYGGNKFVAVGSSGETDSIMYSPDGINWTSVSVPEANFWNSVTYGANKFVAVASTGTNRVMYSPDGINWISASAPEDNSWYGVTYGNNKFVAVGRSGTNRVMYSFTGEGPAARFLAYDETNGKAVNDLNIVARYGVDPEGDNTDLGIYSLTEQPTYEVQGYNRAGDEYQPIRDYTIELAAAQAEAEQANARLDTANATIETMRADFESRIAALEAP